MPLRPHSDHRPPDACASFGRRQHDAVAPLELPLRAAATRHLLAHDFGEVSRQLLALESSRRIQGLHPRVSRAAFEAIAAKAREACAGLARCAEALPACDDRQVPTGPPPAPTGPAANGLAPGAHAYVELLLQADRVLHRIEQAERRGLLAPSDSTRLVRACGAELLAFNDAVHQQQRIVSLHIRQLDAVARIRRRELVDGSGAPAVRRTAAAPPARQAGPPGSTS